MISKFLTVAVLAAPFAGLALTAPAAAEMHEGHGATVLQTAQSDEFGTYLTDGEGRPVYIFTADTRGEEGKAPEIACTSDDCLSAWPPVTTMAIAEAGAGAEADMIATTTFKTDAMVTYNGWPLYYFVRDQAEGVPQGQDIESFGGEWYLIGPDGEKVTGPDHDEDEHAKAMEKHEKEYQDDEDGGY